MSSCGPRVYRAGRGRFQGQRPAREPGVEPGVVRHCARKLVARLDPRPPGGSHARGEFGVVEQRRDAIREGAVVATREVETLDAVADDLAVAANCRDDRRQAGRHRFEQSERRGLTNTGQREGVGGAEPVGDVGLNPDEVDTLRDSKRRRQCGECRAFGAVADQQQVEFGQLGGGEGEAADQRGLILDRVMPRDVGEQLAPH